MKIINKLKTTKGMAIGILVLFSLVLGLSYGTFISIPYNKLLISIEVLL